MIPRSTTNTPINPDDPLVGRTIEGKFLIESLVGEGAMGAVYRARHLTLEKPVAVKIMHAEHACTESFAARFQREARAASRLDHPNSVRVIDFGRAPDGLLYLVMELLEGRDLFATIEEDWPLSSERVVSLLSQTLAALAAAHDAGVIHRDVKPENVMVLSGTTEDGAPADLVKVCDFGIARVAEVKEERVLSGRRRITGIGVAVGTPEYMSPEQAMGAEVDARTDLYSAGVVLFQMLTKRVPFTSSTPMGVAMMHLTDPPPEITTLAPHAHPGLVSVCERAMAKSPADRFQTAREMRSALRGVLDRAASGPPSLRASAMTSASTSARRRFDPATPTVAEHPGPSETPRSPARVRPIAVALVALGVGVLSLGAARRASTQSPPAATRTLESSPIEPPPTELKTTEWSSPAPPSPTPVSLSIVRPRLRPTRLAAATAEPATAQETPPKSSAPVPQATTPPAPALQPAVGDPEPPPALAPHATAEPPPPP